MAKPRSRKTTIGYPGPKPQTRVMGILMLADGVEAASRSLQDPTPITIRAVIRKLFDAAIQDGQLDETDLTLSDLHKVSEAFFQVLSNIFHRRVDYPGFDFGDKRPAAEPAPAQPLTSRQLNAATDPSDTAATSPAPTGGGSPDRRRRAPRRSRESRHVGGSPACGSCRPLTTSLVVRLVADDEMRSINQRFRDKDSVTDVLSFPGRRRPRTAPPGGHRDRDIDGEPTG